MIPAWTARQRTLHEAGFNSGLIEKALAHETKGIRVFITGRSMPEQRREMLQWWADFVDSQTIKRRAAQIIGRFGKAYRAVALICRAWQSDSENRVPLFGWRGF